MLVRSRKQSLKSSYWAVIYMIDSGSDLQVDQGEKGN